MILKRLLLSSLILLSVDGCSIFHDRPVQLMSDTAAALKAAREVSADSLSPEKFRRATEAYFRAQNEYRMKNFQIAEDYAKRAKLLAEESEFEALRQGSARTSLLPPETPVAPPGPSTYEPPEGELATEVMKRESAGPSAQGSGSGANTGTGSGASSKANSGTGGSAGGTGSPQQFAPNFSP